MTTIQISPANDMFWDINSAQRQYSAMHLGTLNKGCSWLDFMLKYSDQMPIPARMLLILAIDYDDQVNCTRW